MDNVDNFAQLTQFKLLFNYPSEHMRLWRLIFTCDKSPKNEPSKLSPLSRALAENALRLKQYRENEKVWNKTNSALSQKTVLQNKVRENEKVVNYTNSALA